MNFEDDFRLYNPLTTGIDGEPLDLFRLANPQNPRTPPQLSQVPSLQALGGWNVGDCLSYFTSPVQVRVALSSFPDSGNAPRMSATVKPSSSEEEKVLDLMDKTNDQFYADLLKSDLDCLVTSQLNRSTTVDATAVQNSYQTCENQESGLEGGNTLTKGLDMTDIPVPQSQCYQSSVIINSDSKGAVSIRSSPMAQEISRKDAEEILTKPATIEIPDMVASTTRKRLLPEYWEHENREENDIAPSPSKHQGNGGPAYLVREEGKEGDFSYQTITVFCPEVCPYCEKPFPLEADLAHHVQKKHRKASPPRQRQKRGNLRCHKCGMSFTCDANLRRHHGVVHAGRITAVCDVCSAPFSSRHGYVVHMRDAHGVVPDSVRERFASSCVGKAHKKLSQVDKEKGWIVRRCGSCAYWTTCKGNMVRHIRIAHLKLRVHECDICGKKFKTKSNMQAHRGSVHSDADDMIGTETYLGRRSE